MSRKQHLLDWPAVESRCERMFSSAPPLAGQRVYGVPRGGVPVALVAARLFGLGLAHHPQDADIIVDDIIDSGATRERITKLFPHARFHALVDQRNVPEADREWFVFPWEMQTAAGETETVEDNVRRLLQAIGENPKRDGLLDTPKRFVKALRELTSGSKLDPARHLTKRFKLNDSDPTLAYKGAIVSAPIPFVSLCEHHMLPFHGNGYIAYIPNEGNEGVVGLSKLARMFEEFALRLQVQERLTAQVTNAIDAALQPLGVAVMIKAQHSCQCFRGVRKAGSMVTVDLRGAYKEVAARDEFFKMCEFSRDG